MICLKYSLHAIKKHVRRRLMKTDTWKIETRKRLKKYKNSQIKFEE